MVVNAYSNTQGWQHGRSGATVNYLDLFLKSREAMGVSGRTLQFYGERLTRIYAQVDCTNTTRQQIQDILNSIPPNKNGHSTRHATYRALKTFYRWLNREYGFENPVDGIPAPILNKLILPTLSLSQVKQLLAKAPDMRTRAVIALFVESGLRLTELANLRLQDIDWASHTLRVLGKGRKEAEAPFGQLTEEYLKAWLIQRERSAKAGSNVWGISASGIASMLCRLGKSTGIHCNPHVFRRTFAVLLRKAGVDCMTIQKLGRWESISMVQRYTRAFDFRDSMRFYKAPLSSANDENNATFRYNTENSETLRGILNSGYKRGGGTSVCVGQGANIGYRDFSTFCPKAIAGIGQLPNRAEEKEVKS